MEKFSAVKYAISYAKMGISVFPIIPLSKKPATKNGFKDATTDLDQIKRWWKDNPNFGIAIATGKVSGNIFVIDCDVDENMGYNGYHALQDYCRENDVEFPDTVMALSGRKGSHFYYRAKQGYSVKSRTGIIEGVDIRGEGGYIICPPTIHPNGNAYEWEQDFNDIAIAEATEDVYNFLERNEKQDNSEQFTLPDSIPKGMRNTTFYKLACSLQAKGLSDDIIHDVVMKEAEKRATPAMNRDDIEELENTIQSALKKEKGKLKLVPFIKPQASQFITLKKRETKNGEVLIQSIENVCTVLRIDENLAGKIKYNELSYSPFIYGELPWTNGDNYREWNNFDDSNLKCYIEDTYGLNSMDKILEALNIVISENRFNPVVDYLEQIEWDGKQRIKNLLSDYLGVEQNEYSETAMKLFMLGAVSRAYNPGCKFDYMPVLVGEQGVGKSTFFKILAGNDAWYNDNFNTVEGDKAAEKLRGMWIVELAELLATKKAKEVESIKAFITSTVDSYRAPYSRRTEQRPRICVFAGTTNNSHFMTDKTGNRRYLPLVVRKSHVKKSLFDNPKEVQQEFRQAWAEAVHIYKTEKPRLIFPKHLENMVVENQKQFAEEDVRVGIIQSYLDDLSASCEKVCVMQLWESALGNDGKLCERRISNEIHDILEHSIQGWERVKNASGGRCRTTKYGVQVCYERIQNDSDAVTNINEKSEIQQKQIAISDLENPFLD